MCCVDRRSFLGIAAAGAAGRSRAAPANAPASSKIEEWDPARPQAMSSKKIVVLD